MSCQDPYEAVAISNELEELLNLLLIVTEKVELLMEDMPNYYDELGHAHLHSLDAFKLLESINIELIEE